VFFLDPSFWFLAPLTVVVLGLALTPIMPSRDLAGLTTAGSVLAALVGLAATGFWSWFFRDGLGPGMVVSQGLLAWIRFAEGFWLPFLVFGAGLCAAGWGCRRRLARLGKAMQCSDCAADEVPPETGG
jgi:hypothetical protein